MLDAHKQQASLLSEERPVATEEPSLTEHLTYALGVIRRQFLVVIVLAIAGAAGGAVVLLKSPVKYAATATLLVDTRKIDILQQPTISSEISMQSTGAMESQIALLQSDGIAFAVINKLKLLDDPRFIGSGRPGALTAMLKRFAPGLFPERPRPSEQERAELGLKLFEKSLTVERVGVAYVIEIEFEASHPDLAADVANAVAEAYINQQRTSAYEAGRRTSDWLEARIPELRAKSETAQRAVVEYKTEHNIVETGSGQLVDDQRVADLLAKLNAAHDETIKAKAKFDRLAPINGTAVTGNISGALQDKDQQQELFDKLQSEYFDVASKEADALAKYGSNNPAIISLRNQKTQLRAEINEEFQRIKESSRNDYSFLQSREAQIQKEYDTAVAQSQEIRHAQVKLRELEASAKAYQDLYNTFINRYNASLQEAASPVAEASVISPASALIQPDSKKAVKFAAMFPLAGLALGLGIALMREVIGGRVFRTSKSVQSRLRVPCIGLLPKAKEGTRLRRRAKQPASDGDGKFIVRGDKGVCWAVVDHPFSRFSEGVRSIKLALEMDTRARASKVIGFISANPNEGKSTVSMAAAQLVARNGAQVIVVDCDLRNPSLTRSVAPHAKKGVVDLLRKEVSLENAILTDSSTGLSFLPAIPYPGPPDPPTILSSSELKALFEELRKKYDYVFVDLSPLSPVIDVCATIEFIDSYVLVIEWGHTTTDAVRHALRAAPAVAELIIGAVLNKADMKELASYDPYLTSYYFDKGTQN